MFDPRVGEISVVRFPHDRTMSIRFPIPSLETASASASASGHFSSSEQNRIIVVAVAAVAASPVHKIKLHFFQFSNFVRVNLAELWVREWVCVYATDAFLQSSIFWPIFFDSFLWGPFIMLKWIDGLGYNSQPLCNFCFDIEQESKWWDSNIDPRKCSSYICLDSRLYVLSGVF